MRDKVKLNLSPENRRLFARRQRENRANPTNAERHVMGLLAQLKEHYIFEKGIFTETKFFIADFYLPAPRRIILEIDGPIHEHKLGYDFVRDNYIMRTRRIRAIIRVSNDDALKMKASELKQLIGCA